MWLQHKTNMEPIWVLVLVDATTVAPPPVASVAASASIASTPPTPPISYKGTQTTNVVITQTFDLLIKQRKLAEERKYAKALGVLAVEKIKNVSAVHYGICWGL